MSKNIIVILGCVLFVMRSAVAAEVALFTNTQYVDYNQGDFNTVVNLDNEPDIYEDDNTSASARVIQANFSGFSQQHTIHSGEDEDWVQFYGESGSVYYFELTHQGGPGNLVLELYDTDGTTLLCSAVVTETDRFDGLDESCGFDFDEVAFYYLADQVAIYYLRVSLESPASGVGPSYILNVRIDGAFESSIRGSVKDSNGNALEAVVLRASPQGFSSSSSYTMSGINGDYVIDLFPQNNPFILSVDKSGFIAQEIPFTAPHLSGLKKDIVMIPETPLGERDDDGDGLTNDAEIDLGTDPNDEDTDDDTMPDGYEFDHGLNPLITDANGDLDGDGLTNLDEFRAGTDPSISEDAPPQLGGTVKTADGTDICAMVLASGQFMFSCNPVGVFSLTDLPREKDGTIKRQIYADGFFPKVDVLADFSDDAVAMTRSGICPSYNTPYDPAFAPVSAGKSIDIAGKVLMPDGQTPICAMVLANGQYTFSCDGAGSYALNIPLDSNGQFKLQVYADGFAPTVQTFDEFKTTNNVRMARSLECQ